MEISAHQLSELRIQREIEAVVFGQQSYNFTPAEAIKRAARFANASVDLAESQKKARSRSKR